MAKIRIFQVEFLTGVQINKNSISSAIVSKERGPRSVEKIWREDGMTFIQQTDCVISVPDVIVRLWRWESDEAAKATK